MKKLVLSLIAVTVATAAFGQATISMNSMQSGGYVRFVNQATGAAATDAQVGLYWNSVADPEAGGWQMAGAAAGVTGAAQYPTNPNAHGFVNTVVGGGNRVIGSPTGTAPVTAYFQLRAWTGGYASYEAALASGNASALRSLISGAGSAPVVQATAVVPPTPVPTIAWGGTAASPVVVQMVPVPEPSTIALAGLGLLGLLFIRRRK